MKIIHLIIESIAALGTVIPIIIGVFTYKRDSKRKAQQDTIEAYCTLQNNTLSKISRLTPSEVSGFANKRKSEEYKQFTEYLMDIECFCIGIEKGIYDFDVFDSLARDYFNDEKGPIRPTIQPMLEAKNKNKNEGEEYYQALDRIWKRMESRKTHRITN